MTLGQMGKGEKANVTCPDYLDVQRNECPLTYNISEGVRNNVTYEFEIIDCGPQEPMLA